MMLVWFLSPFIGLALALLLWPRGTWGRAALALLLGGASLLSMFVIGYDSSRELASRSVSGFSVGLILGVAISWLVTTLRQRRAEPVTAAHH